MTALELKVPPVVLVAFVAVGMWALSRISPDFSIAIPAAGWVASGIALVGMAIAVLGVLAFRTAGTTVDPRVPDQSESLVVSGIYRYSRNPMYLGFLMVLCAWGLWLGNVPALLFLPAFVLYMNRFQIAPEERFMREKFGDAFTRYCTGVRRWL
ncbi:protein-S-isoprenylcysteine methyltransferase [Marinobacter sp. EhC06]|uniref:methyltransferase family protein n=1 Tax=Marinobacter TaxID=2742 RepID=UPI0007D8D97F|nr:MULTISPECIES: isoprenylcysteine carboxylmethyltransferase family protein [Marinobacter]OAN88481.1 protein-S-isoprenylcysteine methyltransferase [Marinobacter sp. EhN04]OAN91463.1 protein-S-isoprenylcysteine methyltransferase [Marinobacter sp. EhC06]